MKKSKLFFWILIVGAIALLVFQNEGYFMETQQVLRLNLKVFPEYQSPNLPLVAYHLLFFVFGLIVAYLFSTLDRWRRRKNISRLLEKVSTPPKLCHKPRDTAGSFSPLRPQRL